jgi:hypothetical protein
MAILQWVSPILECVLSDQLQLVAGLMPDCADDELKFVGHSQGVIGGTLMMKTSLRVVLPQLLVKAMNFPSRLISARGVSQ